MIEPGGVLEGEFLATDAGVELTWDAHADLDADLDNVV